MRKIIDGRRLTAPEPFERVMEALDSLGDNDDILLLLHCSPVLLYRALRRNDFAWREVPRDDGTIEIYITRHRLGTS